MMRAWQEALKRAERWPTSLRSEVGATLLEMVVASAIFALVLATVYSTLISSKTVHARNTISFDMHTNAHFALPPITRALLSAGMDPTEAGIFGFVDDPSSGFTPVASDTQITFTLDANGDAVLQENSTEVQGFRRAGAGPPFTLERLLMTGGGITYQFTDKDGNVLTRDFTKEVAPGALATLNLKVATAVPGATPPVGCAADCYAYGPNGAPDPANIPPANLGYVGGFDVATYGTGHALTGLVSVGGGPGVEVWTLLARQIQSIQFIYMDDQGNPLPNPATPPYTLDAAQRAQIRRIGVRITIGQTGTGFSLGGRQFRYTLTTDVTPRNLQGL